MRCSSILFALSFLALAGCAATQGPVVSTDTASNAPAPVGIHSPASGSSNAPEDSGKRRLPSGPIDALLNEVV